MKHRILLNLIGALVILLGSTVAYADEAKSVSPGETAFNQAKGDRGRLRQFLHKMPKGALLHAHLTGELNPALIIELSEKNGYYVRSDGEEIGNIGLRRDMNSKLIAPETYEKLTPEGKSHFRLLADWFKTNPANRDALHELTTYQYDEPPIEFFGPIFDRIDEPSKAEAFQDALFCDVIKRFHDERVNYLELRINIVLAARPGQMERYRKLLKQCNDQWPADEAVDVRYIVGVLRGRDTTMAHLASAFEVVASDNAATDDLVGVDLVGLEDAAGATSRYLGPFREALAKYPNTAITLHSGESNEPDNNVRDAILMGARRIGHGTNTVADRADTLRLAKDNGILMEISLLSNYLTLKKPTANHPMWIYLNCGIPLSLNTDDGGIFDTTLTDEFTEAVSAFDLNWQQVRGLCENSIQHCFAQPDAREGLLNRWQSRWRQFELDPSK